MSDINMAALIGDEAALTEGLRSLAERLNLEKISRIECIDISHMGGKSTYGSLVVWESMGLNKNLYRSYKLENYAGDDYGSVYSVITRRYRDNVPPEVLIIDGGKAHLSYIARKMNEDQAMLSKMAHCALIGIVKAESRDPLMDRIFIHSQSSYLGFKDNRDIFVIVQKLRDEAHRFAKKAMLMDKKASTKLSELSKIPGVGEKRRQSLISHFGNALSVAGATIAQLSSVPGIGKETASLVWNYYNPDEPGK